ncbi:MAG TPA: hypothetical protein VES39_01425 [Rhodospirillales bacterium]|nr:hypothetical protein [Rhodospirillales bacterium]
MSGWTNRGAYRMLGVRFRGQSNPSAFHLALVTATPTPDDADNTLGDLSEIADGNGYTAGGQALSPGSTDFDVWTEDDANHRALVQLRDVLWTASGGAIPGSGDDARYAVLTDANATVGSREVFHFWNLGSALSALAGQSLTVRDAEIQLVTV